MTECYKTKKSLRPAAMRFHVRLLVRDNTNFKACSSAEREAVAAQKNKNIATADKTLKHSTTKQ